MYRLALFLLAAVASMSASAQSEVFTYTQQGNAFTFAAQPLTAANVPQVRFSSNGTPLLVSSTRAVASGGGVNIPIAATGTVSSPNIGRAVGRFALRAVGVLAVGAALYDFADEMGFLVDRSSGSLTVQSIEVEGTFTYGCFLGEPSGGGCMGKWLQANRAFDPKCEGVQGPFNTGVSFFQGRQYAHNSLATHNGRCPLGEAVEGRRMVSLQPSARPATLQDLENAIASQSGWPSNSHVGRVLTDAINAGEVVPVDSPSVTGPLTLPLDPIVVRNPDGSVTTTTREKVATYGPGPTVSTSTRETTTTTSPTGQVTPGPVVTRPDEPVIVVPDPATDPAVTEPEPTTNCGLPDTPACILDPSGIPSAQSVPTDTLEREHDPIRDLVQDPSSVLPQLPTISWLFALPTSCGPIDFGGAFDPFITQVDICQFQPMFHDIMSLVWALGGLFGAISMFLRSTPA